MNRLSSLRKSANKTQLQFAKEIGVAQNTVSNWENGNRQIDSVMLIKIASYFDVSVDYLLGNTDIKKAPDQYAPGAAVIGMDGEQFINYYENADLADELFALSERLDREKFEALVSIAKSIKKIDTSKDSSKLKSLSDIAEQLTK